MFAHPAIVGFNFNDTNSNVRPVSKQLEGSGTNDVVKLTNTSNIVNGRPGVWIFQVDEAELRGEYSFLLAVIKFTWTS